MKAFLRNQVDRVARRISSHIPKPPAAFAMKGDSFDLRQVAAFQAAVESAAYMQSHMSTVELFDSAFDILDFAVDRSPDGVFMEFGVASGTTINHIAKRAPGRTIIGFDSFEGLPETWRPEFREGAFSQKSLPAVLPNVELVRGLFEVAIPAYLSNHRNPVGLLHIDCDLYSSTKTAFDHIGALPAPKCVVVFNEYFNYPGWQHHEHKAFREFLKSSGRTARYVGAVPSHQQICAILDQ